MTYNEIIKKAGKRIVKHVYYEKDNKTIYVDDNNVDTVKFIDETPLIGTSISGCELTLKEKIDGKIYVDVVATYQGQSATKTYGFYILKEEPKYNADKKNYTHKMYDNMINSMVDYSKVNIDFPCSVYQFFIKVVEEIGYTTNIVSLPNGHIIMENDIYEGINYTYRDVLDDLAIANGVLLYVDDNELKIAEMNDDTAYINDDILRNANISFGQHYGPINSIVLSRAAESDNIYLQDEESIKKNGLCEFKIIDNQLMNGNDRDQFLPELLKRLKGIEYDIYDTELIGYGDLKPLQKVVFETGNNTYNSYIFNNEITLTTGYKQAIYNELPEESVTEYKASDKTDRKINQAYALVDKQNLKITQFVSETSSYQESNDEKLLELAERTNSVEQTINSTQETIEVIQKDIIDGRETLRNSLVTIDINGIEVSTNLSAISTLITNEKFVIKSGDKYLAYFGYDEETNSTKAEMDNLTVTNYLTAGYHRTEKMTINGENRTGFFYVG